MSALLPFPFNNATNLTGLQSGDTWESTVGAANAAILTAACAAGGYYRIPEAGTYRVTTASYAANVLKPTIFVGPKLGTATLQSGPDLPLVSSTMFQVVDGGSLTLLDGIELVGPPNVSYGVQVDFSDSVPTFGVRVQDGAELDIDSVNLSKWMTCIKMEESGTLTVRNSNIGGRILGILGTEVAATGSVTVENCNVALDSDNGKAVGQVHNFYINLGFNLFVRASRFTRAGSGTYPGFGVLAGYGGSHAPTAQRVISGCSFSGMARPVYCGSTGSTLVEKCTFNSSGDDFSVIQLTPAGAFECNGSTFTGLVTNTHDGYAILDDQNTSASGTVTGCRFSGDYVYVARRTVAGAAGYITFDRCYMGVPDLYTLGSDASCGTIVCTNTDFGLTVGDLADNHPNARVILIDCTRAGANTFSGLG